MAFAETADLAVRLSLKDQLTAGLRKSALAVKNFDKATSNTQRSIEKMGHNLTRLATVGLAATAGALIGVVKAASDYESAFAGVRKTVTATEPQLERLSDEFRSLAKVIPISAAALARLGEAGGALGIATEDLREFVRVSALLGVTTDLSADQAANSLGILSNVLHLTGDEYDNFASSLVALGNAGASTESQIIEIAQRAGAAGELIGLTTAQVLGFASSVASLGIEIEAGGTALQKFFIDTTKQVAKGGKEFKLLAKVAGMSAKEFARAYDKDAGAALQRFLAGLGKLSKAEQLAVLELLGFNDVRITRTLLGLANNTGLVADQMNIANEAFKANTALTKEAEQRFKTFDSALQITKNTFTDMAITIGSQLLPKLVPLLTRLNDFINSHQADIAKFGADLASGFEKFANAISKVDFKGLVGGLELTGRVAKTIVDAFLSLPPDIQKLAVAALAINKVGGGIITSGLKDIVGLVLTRLTTIQAANVNVIGANVVGGGTPGAGGGGVGGVVKAVATVAVVGIAAEAARELTSETNKQLADIGRSERLQVAQIFNPIPALQNIGALISLYGDAPQKVDVVAQSGGISPAERAEIRAQTALIVASVRDDTLLTGQTIHQLGSSLHSANVEMISGIKDDTLVTARTINALGTTLGVANQQLAFQQRDNTLAEMAQMRLTGQQTAYAIRDVTPPIVSAQRQAAQITQAAAFAIRDRVTAAGNTVAAAARAAGERAHLGGQQAAFAIRDKKMSITTTVHTALNVDGRAVARALYKYKAYPV